MPLWNARSMMEIHTPAWKPSIIFSSDASGSWGCGAAWENKWLQAHWGNCWLHHHIACKELLLIVIACAVWGPYWKHKKIQVLCDNMAVVHILNALSSKDKSILHLMCCLHFFCAHFDIKLRAVHISGVLNDIADAISRNHMQVFRRLLPSALPNLTPIPSPLWQMLVVQTPDWLSPTWRALLKSSLDGVSLQAHTEHTVQPKDNM